MLINAMLTDLDGVVRDWSVQDAAGIERQTGLPPGTITGAAFHPDLLVPAITGRITDDAWRHMTSQRLRAQHPEADVDRAMAAWSEPAGVVDEPVLSIIQEVRRHVPVALITNATDRLPRDLERLGILDAFDLIVNSSEVGAAKPDRKIFLHALEQIGVPAEKALYVDDTERYMVHAQELGLITHHFTGIDGLRAALARHAVPITP